MAKFSVEQWVWSIKNAQTAHHTRHTSIKQIDSPTQYFTTRITKRYVLSSNIPAAHIVLQIE